MYSNPYIVLFCLTVVSLITFTWTITFDLPPSEHDDPAESSDERQKETVLFQCYTLSWILLLLSTIAVGKAQVGGLYFITYWSVGLWFACALASVETVFGVHTPKTHSRLQSRSRSRSGERQHPGYYGEATERTPLTHDQDDEHNGAQGSYTENGRENGHGKAEGEDGPVNWWLLQFLLVVPAPVVIVAHIGNMLLDATSQTLADGNSKAAGK